jgi:peptidoglycan/LPS O-acetylase OafA/YrhL
MTKNTGDQLHVASLDGIRAVAFTIVFVSHAGLGQYIPGGFGVTVFFFLSGYLITTLLRREFELTGNISLKSFYLRRVLRIFPPLYITLALMIVATLCGLLPGKLGVQPVLSEVLFLTNYYLLFGANPDGMPAGSGVLWSLSVEEHFYLLFPLLCLMLMPTLSSRRQALFLVCLCALVLAWRIALVAFMGDGDDRTYWATDTRIDSLLFGCVLGLFCNPALDQQPPLSTSYKVGLYIGAGALLLVSFLYRDEMFRFTFRYTLEGIALLPLFYLAVKDWRAPWFSWLNSRPMRFFGLLSYSMYLVHHSIILSLKSAWPASGAIAQGFVAFMLTTAYAIMMYYLIERPCALLRRRLNKSAYDRTATIPGSLAARKT